MYVSSVYPEFGIKKEACAWILPLFGDFYFSAGQGVAVVVVAFLTFLNCLGVQEGKWTQNIFTVAKTLALALLIVLGLTVAANPKAIEANTADLWGGATQTDRFFEISRRVQSVLPVGGLLVVFMVAVGSSVGWLF